MQIKQLTEEKAKLQRDIKTHQRTELNLNEALEEAQSRYDQALLQTQLESEESLTRVKENYENIMREKAEKKMGFIKTMQWVHEMLTQFFKVQLKMAEDDKTRLLRSVKELQLTVENQARTIGDLQNQLGESDVVQLKKRVAQLEDLIVTKNLELSAAKRAEKDMFHNWFEEKEGYTTAVLKVDELTHVNKRLENEIKEINTKYHDKMKELNKTKQANDDLSEFNFHLKCTLKTTKQDNINLKAKVKESETFRLRVKKGLQGCVSVIGDPKMLASRVSSLKELYTDTDKSLPMDEETNSAFKRHIDHVRKTDRVRTCSSELPKKQKQPDKANKHVDQTRRVFIKLLNEKIMEVHKLKKELKQTHLQLRKATKPAHQKMILWINKKLCRSSRVSPVIPETLPKLYPEDWQPPDLD
ncbi:hypothetical protein Q8A73_006978 [Channa argus]|nr:hypothetical protein Q8A73_006978 [Channa argus]